MPRNKYFSNGTRSERDLLDSLVQESIQIHGQDVYYLPRNIVKLDNILNEDILSKFDTSYVIEMYLESVDGFEGEGKLISKFGLEIRDQITLVVSVRRWNQLVGRFGKGQGIPQVRPSEGDLIYLPLTKGLFEIKFVEDRKPFFQLGGSPTYKLICELFEYANQDLDTGIPEIDNIQSYSSQGFAVIADFQSSINKFTIGEKVSFTLPNGVIGSAEILKQVKTNILTERKLFLGNVSYIDSSYHAFSIGSLLHSNITGFDAEVTQVLELIGSTDNDTQPNDDTSQNAEFEKEGNDWLDFSESNPFGNPYE